jgi:hypothetical protein
VCGPAGGGRRGQNSLLLPQELYFTLAYGCWTTLAKQNWVVRVMLLQGRLRATPLTVTTADSCSAVMLAWTQ